MTTCTAAEGCAADAVTMKLCNKHYKRTRPRTPDRMMDVTCECCGAKFQRARRKQRHAGVFCSWLCRSMHTHGPTSSKLPADHWARWYGASSEWAPAVQPASFQCGTCDDCGAGIIEPGGQTPSAYCSDQCRKRVHRRRRRAREADAPGEFTWAQVMRQLLRQGTACAYCGERTLNPDPDHVVPLSRGGRNDMSNIVAACRACNTDKNDLTLDEWSTDRARRSLPPRNTSMHSDAYKHLWLIEPTAPAWRDRTA